MKSLPIEPKLLNEIKSGLYQNHFLIYNRKSTDEAENQKNSIQYQKKENLHVIKKEKLRLSPLTIKGFCRDGVISERHSGFKESSVFEITDRGEVVYRIERPKFQQLLWFLSRGYFKGVVCLSWDRISRNEGDDTAINKLMKQGVSFQFAKAFYEENSSGALHMDVDKMFAKHHSRATSEKVTLATRNLRSEGVCTYKAPVGYQNLGDMHDKPFDEVRAPIIRGLFERYATGDWSFASLARWANEQGFTMPPVRRKRTIEELLADYDDDEGGINAIPKIARPLTYQNVYKILKNPFYTGKILDSNGTYIPSNSHKALISEELFTKVQSVKGAKKISVHYSKRLPLFLRGLIKCAECGRTYCPYTKKGIQYFGVKCKKGCSNPIKNINLTFIEGKIQEVVSRLYFTDEEKEQLNNNWKLQLDEVEEKRKKALEENERKKKRVREDLRYLKEEKLTLLKTGVFTVEEFLLQEAKLNQELASLKREEDASDIAISETVKELINLSELLKNVATAYLYGKSGEKEEITRILFSELLLFGETLSIKAQREFECLKTRFDYMGEPKAMLSELLQNVYKIQYATKQLESLVANISLES